MSEVNEGVQIILNRMESNPEEFFGDVGKWRWIFSETLREVMTEPEKAAIHTAMTKVRRLELTAKAVASVMPSDDEEDEDTGYKWAKAEAPKRTGHIGVTAQEVNIPPKKMTINAAQAEMIKRMNRTSN